MERFQWLAAIIAAHPEHKVIGRTRLQKTVKLLQRLGVPTRFGYKLHHYGPYSEDLQSEIGLLQNIGLITETAHTNNEGSSYYTLQANNFSAEFTKKSEFEPYQHYIEILSREDQVILELAATYDTYKEMGFDDFSSIEQLKEKKGAKCEDGRADKSISLLKELGLM